MSTFLKEVLLQGDCVEVRDCDPLNDEMTDNEPRTLTRAQYERLKQLQPNLLFIESDDVEVKVESTEVDAKTLLSGGVPTIQRH